MFKSMCDVFPLQPEEGSGASGSGDLSLRPLSVNIVSEAGSTIKSKEKKSRRGLPKTRTGCRTCKYDYPVSSLLIQSLADDAEDSDASNAMKNVPLASDVSKQAISAMATIPRNPPLFVTSQRENCSPRPPTRLEPQL